MSSSASSTASSRRSPRPSPELNLRTTSAAYPKRRGATATTLVGCGAESVGGASGVAEGIPLTIKLTVVDSSSACAPISGYAVYLWHCDRAGNYSMYSAAVVNENYLRGVQETATDGPVTFTTIFPGCYAGRWPHVHFEVYPSAAVATSGANKVATSQLAFPKESCDEAYAAAEYETSVRNLAGVSLEGDNVFSDGVSKQLATIGRSHLSMRAGHGERARAQLTRPRGGLRSALRALDPLVRRALGARMRSASGGRAVRHRIRRVRRNLSGRRARRQV